jgi:predicted transcriptional regulator
MATFTSTLPNELLTRLDVLAKKMSMPKNKIIEKPLLIYLDQLTRAEYVRSYKPADADTDLLALAEEGMEDYLKQLNSLGSARFGMLILIR